MPGVTGGVRLPPEPACAVRRAETAGRSDYPPKMVRKVDAGKLSATCASRGDDAYLAAIAGLKGSPYSRGLYAPA